MERKGKLNWLDDRGEKGNSTNKTFDLINSKWRWRWVWRDKELSVSLCLLLLLLLLLQVLLQLLLMVMTYSESASDPRLMLGRFGPQFRHAVHPEIVDWRPGGVMELSGCVAGHISAGLGRRRMVKVRKVMTRGGVGTRRELVVALIAANGFSLVLFVATRVTSSITAISFCRSSAAATSAASGSNSAVFVVVFLIAFVAAGQLMRGFQGLPMHTCNITNS